MTASLTAHSLQNKDIFMIQRQNKRYISTCRIWLILHSDIKYYRMFLFKLLNYNYSFNRQRKAQICDPSNSNFNLQLLKLYILDVCQYKAQSGLKLPLASDIRNNKRVPWKTLQSTKQFNKYKNVKRYIWIQPLLLRNQSSQWSSDIT